MSFVLRPPSGHKLRPKHTEGCRKSTEEQSKKVEGPLERLQNKAMDSVSHCTGCRPRTQDSGLGTRTLISKSPACDGYQWHFRFPRIQYIYIDICTVCMTAHSQVNRNHLYFILSLSSVHAERTSLKFPAPVKWSCQSSESGEFPEPVCGSVCVFWPEVAIPALNAYKFNLVFCGTSSPAASVAFVVLSCFVILFVLAKNKPGVRSTESSRSNIYILAWLNTLAVDFRPRIALV